MQVENAYNTCVRVTAVYVHVSDYAEEAEWSKLWENWSGSKVGGEAVTDGQSAERTQWSQSQEKPALKTGTNAPL